MKMQASSATLLFGLNVLLVISATFLAHQAISERTDIVIEFHAMPLSIRVEVKSQPVPTLLQATPALPPALPNTLDNVAVLGESETLGS